MRGSDSTVAAAMVKDSSVWGQISMGKPLFIEGSDLLAAKADSGQILA
jgi:hypothetical protein